MRAFLLVGLGGFVGAIARYGLTLLVRTRFGPTFPLGTLVVNVLGCLAIGVALGLARSSASLGEGTRLVIVVGLLGSFTTFSTFGHETLELVADANLRGALLSVALNLILGLGAVALGAAVVR